MYILGISFAAIIWHRRKLFIDFSSRVLSAWLSDDRKQEPGNTINARSEKLDKLIHCVRMLVDSIYLYVLHRTHIHEMSS